MMQVESFVPSALGIEWLNTVSTTRSSVTGHTGVKKSLFQDLGKYFKAGRYIRVLVNRGASIHMTAGMSVC